VLTISVVVVMVVACTRQDFENAMTAYQLAADYYEGENAKRCTIHTSPLQLSTRTHNSSSSSH
jgi:hypothetical protein